MIFNWGFNAKFFIARAAVLGKEKKNNHREHRGHRV
jgi:hypothetical protein